MGLEFIKPGDKIDIHYLHQSNSKPLKSSVYDILSDTELEIVMPTLGGKMVLFQVGIACQYYFYTNGGVYTCEAVVKERNRKGNFYVLKLKLTSGLKKFQRRDYFRLQCLIDFSYYKISKEIASFETTEDILLELEKTEYQEEKKLARTRDISGGGIRFNAYEPIEVGTKLFNEIHLSNDKMEQTFYLVSEVIHCDPIEQDKDKWMIRAKWYFKNKKERDMIVRFVFEEDRKKRKKEKGI